MTNPVSTYVNEHLRAFLAEKALNEDTVAAVANDMEDRLVSVISRWNDADFRSTLLLAAVEEATFYMPLHNPNIRWPGRLSNSSLSEPRDSLARRMSHRLKRFVNCLSWNRWWMGSCWRICFGCRMARSASCSAIPSR